MIQINPHKWISLFFIVASAFIVSMAGNYFLEWDFQFGMIVGVLLGVWNNLYEMSIQVIARMEGEEGEDGPSTEAE